MLPLVLARPAACETARVYRDPATRWSLLHAAAHAGDLSAVRLLVSVLALDPEAVAANGQRPLDLATQQHHSDVAAYLRRVVAWRAQTAVAVAQ